MYLKTLKSLSKQDILTEEIIRQKFLKEHHIHAEIELSDESYGSFIIKADNFNFLITERPITYLNNKWARVTNLQRKMLDLKIPLPLYIGLGELVRDVNEILGDQTPLEASNRWLFERFSVEVAVSYYMNYFLKSESLSPYKSILFEAIEAFYLGYDHIAIMALFPVFEGGLRNLQNKILGTNSEDVQAEIFEKGLRKILLEWGRKQCADFDWHPGKDIYQEVEIDFFTHLNKQCDVINATLIFFNEILYLPSKRIDNSETQSFNRHIIIHLLKNNFDEPSNFIRIFMYLTHITFIESLYNNNVPFFWDGISDKDNEIAKFIRDRMEMQFSSRRNILENYGLNLYKRT
ncbi:hypothetical protein RSA36_12260 [Pantoea stewartii]|uniref:Uncharacterized protein n=1 Tax=Pantoea stewartii TaxID=66269 RepID=A0AB34VI69_9GAMM|nr:hypothetical protein RSA30_21565 [Pantoea stewartii]KTS99255.1 hypothetical protein RSA13_06015 [Pantoea stewartii]KTT07321.1 hypothetical protein RSA36_12260 [Pantoea stewartii]